MATPRVADQRPAPQGHRAQRRQQEQAAARQRRIVGLAAGAVIVVLVGLFAAKLLTGGTNAVPAPDTPAPDALVAQVTGVPSVTLEQVGRGSLAQLPIAVRGTPQTGPTGLPPVTYIGAEYCPYCAGERWALIVALGRFGTFSGLKLSHSASNDVYPNTATFSFVGASYSSQYVDFSAVELESNVRTSSGYQALQTPTPAQVSLLQTYDAPPYVPAASAGSIPFIDFANQYLVSGASFDVGVLRGMTQDQIAAALADPSSAQARAILGSANALTAAICSSTGNQPASVCSLPTVASLEATLAASPVAGG
jgi:Domain of unknown function (DUF929)